MPDVRGFSAIFDTAKIHAERDSTHTYFPMYLPCVVWTGEKDTCRKSHAPTTHRWRS
jgi:hypothetical protein